MAATFWYNHFLHCFAILHGIRARLLITAHLGQRETCQLNLCTTFALNILMDELELAPLVLTNACSSSLPEFRFFKAVFPTGKCGIVVLTRGSLVVTPHNQALTDDPVALALEPIHVPALIVSLRMLWYPWYEERYFTVYRVQL